MEALECLKTRRSVRKFTEQPVTKEEIEQVVAAAAYAPSWKNTQIARYIVVTDKEKKQRLADDCMMDFAFNQKTTASAPRAGGADHDHRPFGLRAGRFVLHLAGYALAVVRCRRCCADLLPCRTRT